MSKGPAEREVNNAIQVLAQDEPIFAYKPPDDARNRKPCDFFVWMPGHTAWVEVKETRQLTRWPIDELRPAQRLGITLARKVGVPYLLVIRWTSDEFPSWWTLSDGAKVLEWIRDNPGEKSVPVELLKSRFGVDCRPHELGSFIRAAMMGELSDAPVRS